MLNDLRYAIRMLLKSPGFTAIVILTLSLGIGASTAIYTVADSVLFSPVPGPHPERLIQISQRETDPKGKPMYPGVSAPVLSAIAGDRGMFEDLAWFEPTQLDRRTQDFTEQLGGGRVSTNFFAMMRATPLLGRTFVSDEARPGHDAVILLTESFWRSALNADPQVIGRSIELSDRQWTVIGVMPAEFKFPEAGYKFWVPASPPAADYHMVWNATLIARLKEGTTLTQTQARLDVVAARLTSNGLPEDLRRRNSGPLAIAARPLRHLFLDEMEWRSNWEFDLRQMLFGMLGAIGFVLLIACANVANLMLARTEQRQQELAIRSSLGASRARLIRQILTESIVLSLLGGLGGLLVADWAIKLLTGLIPPDLPRLSTIDFDWRVAGIAALLSLATGLVFGSAPALRAGRSRLAFTLKNSGTTSTTDAGARRYRASLVIAQVALAMVLLTGAGLMIESVVRLLHVDPGYDPQHLLRVQFYLPGKYALYGSNADRTRPPGEAKSLILSRLHRRFAAMPDVTAVGIGKDHGWGGGMKCRINGSGEAVDLWLEGTGVAESDLFDAMKIPLLAGRNFDKSDIGSKVGTVIVNQTMAQRCWPGENAVGKSFRQDHANGRVFQVVGVVGDSRIDRYDEAVQPTFYRPYQEFDIIGLGETFVIRTRGDPAALISSVRQALKEAEPGMEPPTFAIAQEVLFNSTQAQRTYVLYLVLFAGVGLLLSAIGIYGVLAYSVARRTREIGIRIAVGAGRTDVLGMVMREGALLVAIGAAAGILAAWGLTRLMQHQLFHVSPTDPAVFGVALLVLAAVVMLACYIPAWRATRIDPVEALRCD